MPYYTGSLPYRYISKASINATVATSLPCNLYGIQAMTTDAQAIYLKLYDQATVPNPLVDIPAKTFIIPGGAQGSNFAFSSVRGIFFRNGIAFTMTKGIADNNQEVVAANKTVLNLDYEV